MDIKQLHTFETIIQTGSFQKGSTSPVLAPIHDYLPNETTGKKSWAFPFLSAAATNSA